MRRFANTGEPDRGERYSSGGAVGGRPIHESSLAGQDDLGGGSPDWVLASGAAAETLLVVDDEPSVRALAAMTLESVGYKVLSASHGVEALELLENAGETVDLIVTDVVMPGMSGPKLAELAKRRRPRVKTLFTSGYTDDSIADQVVMAGELHFIQKPYTITQLTQRVRQVLDSDE